MAIHNTIHLMPPIGSPDPLRVDLFRRLVEWTVVGDLASALIVT